MWRPITAAERITARYIPADYTVLRETKGGIVYAKGNTGLAFKGTAMHSSWHTTFQSMAHLNGAVESFFDAIKRSEDWRQERRATRDKGETDTQKVKKALKDAGYNVASVTRGKGTASNWIEIRIDGYDEYIDQDGYKQRHYGKVLQIAKVASGRQDLYDDISTDLFMVNINASFTKYHRCSECLISDCKEYHTPDSCARECFYSAEMAAADQRRREKWQAEEKAKVILLPPAPEEIPDPVKAISKPAGYLPYLNLSIVEEMI
mgnify:CR=1 FL=1